MSRLACGLALILAAAPLDARAQSVSELEARVGRLEAMHAVARRVRVHADSLRRQSLDTLRSGSLTVLAYRRAAPAVREAMNTMQPQLAAAYGDAAATVVPPAQPVVLWDSMITAWGAGINIGRAVAARLAPPRSHPWMEWTRGAMIPAHSPEDLQRGLERTYIDLVSAPSPATAGCFAGRLRQCRLALELDSVKDPATQWVTPEERRQLARRFMAEERRTVPPLPIRDCAAGTDTACLVAIRSGYLEPSAPLGHTARLTLSEFAVARGGPGAFSRLAAPADNAAQALAHAAGVPQDSVLAAWQAAVLAARPERVATRPGTAWMAVFWTTLVGALALGSPKWRRT